MKILHICAGWEKWNGAANIARLIMGEQSREGHKVSFATWAGIGRLKAADEVWIHCSWKPCLWWAARWGRNVHWMPECSYDPIRRRYHGWKKTLVGPIERFCLRRAKTLVATCEAEKEWIMAYLGKHCPPVEVTDIKRFFDLNHERKEPRNTLNTRNSGELHVLYLGRSHPLKGLEYLVSVSSVCSVVKLKIVSNVFGEELEKVWDWCDVLILPTLSDNFGLVIAEALERGKRVITTDGAPAWAPKECESEKLWKYESMEIWKCMGGRMIYLKGFRDGTEEMRIELLKNAIEGLCK